MKKEVTTVDAKPSKRIYRSIIADYDLNKSICELIDNALDIWVKNNKNKTIKINININIDQQSIYIEDNVGGLKLEELRYIVSPGQTTNLPSDDTIGIFGVGSKRAVVALSQQIKINTHHYKEEKTYSIEYNDDWLSDEENWELPAFEDYDIKKGTTKIELVKLRYTVTERMIDQLKYHLRAIYSKFLSPRKLTIVVNTDELDPITFEDWSFPPIYSPKEILFDIFTVSAEIINVRILGGLVNCSNFASGEYGVYFYMNERLILRSLKDHNVGFGTKEVSLPHPAISLARVFVFLNGPAEVMPWNSSKSGINPNHEVFIKLRPYIVDVIATYTRISRSLESVWDEQVFSYHSGKIERVSYENIDQLKTLPLPSIPRSRFRYEDIVSKLNKKIIEDKPWTEGLYDLIIASDIIYKKRTLHKKNRIALIILDSTLEIALKDYLVAESGIYYTDKKLTEVFEKRHLVINEVKKYTANNTKWNKVWRKVEHYYRLRCKLIHQTASIDILDDDIEKYRKIVEMILKHLFGLRFSN